MKRKAKSLLLICLLVVLLLCMSYFLLAYYYREGFCLNTWINGVYCTGKTVEEVNAELLLKTEAPIVIITDKTGESYSIDMAEVGYQVDYIQPLTRFMETQNPWLWIDNITFHRRHEIEPDISYDEELFREKFEDLSLIKKEQQKRTDYVIEHSLVNGYYLYDGLSDRIDIDKLFQELKKSMDEGDYSLNVKDISCYYDIPLTKEHEEIQELAMILEKFQKCNIIYDMGDQMLSLDAATMSAFVTGTDGEILLDEVGNLVLNQDAIIAFITSLAEEYDTYEKEREFQSTRGDMITVTGVTYGTEINQNAEVSYLMENLLLEETHSQVMQYHIPAYEHVGMVRGKNDIGQTYIEIDMTQQKMYYYEDGVCWLETDVVTGNSARRWDTPEGVNFVYAKQKNRVLRGAGYASPVKYWMPVKGNIGIHDANWRSEFGGTIYQTNGSHGCINTPTEMMAELYERVEIGTPVIMFY